MSVAGHSTIVAPKRRRRLHEPKLVAVRTTSAADGHSHCAIFNGKGAGVTSPGPDGHVHFVRALEIRPSAAAADGHTHDIAGRCALAHDDDGRHEEG